MRTMFLLHLSDRTMVRYATAQAADEREFAGNLPNQWLLTADGAVRVDHIVRIEREADE